jgi:hypothetical protein
MRASVSRTTLVAVLAAAAFATVTAAASADVMTAGTWDGKITGGTLTLGNGDLHDVAVPDGDTFTFTIPAGSAAPVAFKTPATHVPIPLTSETVGGDVWSAAGSLDISPVTGTVDPATGAAAATATAHGILHLDLAPATGVATSLYCHLGAAPAPPTAPAVPAPFALTLPGTVAGGTATLADTTFAVVLDCGVPIGFDPLPVVGNVALPGNALTLTASFTRRADPPAPPANGNGGTTTTKKPAKTVVTPAQQCVVPKLKGLKLKKARKAARKANCAVGKVKRKRSHRKRRTVLKQSKAAGTVLADGAKIKLTIAK